MSTKKAIPVTYPVITMLIGSLAFSISSFFTAFLSIKTNEGIIPILGIPIGNIIMSYMLKRLEKHKVLSLIIISELAFIVSFLAGFIIGYLLEWILSFSLYFKGKEEVFSNIFLCITANASFGAFLATYYFGLKAIGFFAVTCSIISIPFGILIAWPIYVSWFGTDLNLVLFLISFGTSTGFSYGLYSFFKSKTEIN